MAQSTLQRLANRWREEDGASLGEYALVLGVVSVVLVTVLVSFRGAIGDVISRSTTALATSGGAGGQLASGVTAGGSASTSGSSNGGTSGKSSSAPGQGNSDPPGKGGNVPGLGGGLTRGRQ